MRLIVRLIISALVLPVLSFILPSFAMVGFGGALLAAVVITSLGYVVEAIMGKKVSPRRRGIVGFIVAALVIYGAQFFVTAMTVSIIGACIAASFIGIVDTLVPMEFV